MIYLLSAVTGAGVLVGAVGAFLLCLVIAVVLGKDDPAPKGGLFFRVVFPHFKIESTRMDFKNTQFVEGEIVARDAKGDTAEIQSGSVTASSSNEEVATVEVTEDGKVKVTGQRAGAAIITIGADADLGEGVKPITAEVAVNITSSEAVGLGVNFGEPQDQ